MNIIEALDDGKLFKPALKDPKTWRAWRVFLRCLFGLEVKGEDRELARSCLGLGPDDPLPSEPAGEAFVVAGRRSGKSFVSALVACYLATCRDWSSCLGPGERGFVFIIATDRAQAQVVKRYVSGILAGSPLLAPMVELDKSESVELRNRATIAVKTAAFRTIRGYTVLGAVIDEVAFLRDESGANPAKEIIGALRPALAAVPGSLLLGISTPYSKSGFFWETFKRSFGKAEGPLVWRAESREMNPTLRQGVVERALTEDPEAARAEWLAEFRSDLETFIARDALEEVIVPNRAELPPAEGVKYHAFIDPSGGGRDSFTLAVAHLDSQGVAVLDLVRERKPPFSPKSVVEEFAEDLMRYRLAEVRSDRYAGEWPVEAFKAHGVQVKPSELTAPELYLELLPLVNSRAVELLDDARLCGQLGNLERRTRPGGKDLVAHPPGLHDDVANSAAGALVLAARSRASRVGRVFHFEIKTLGEPAEPPQARAGLGRVIVSASPKQAPPTREELIAAAVSRSRRPPEEPGERKQRH